MNHRYWLVIALYFAGVSMLGFGRATGTDLLGFLGAVMQGAAFGVAVGTPSSTWIRPAQKFKALNPPLLQPCACGHDAVFHRTHGGCSEFTCMCAASRSYVIGMQPKQDRLPPIGGQL